MKNRWKTRLQPISKTRTLLKFPIDSNPEMIKRRIFHPQEFLVSKPITVCRGVFPVFLIDETN